MECKKCGKCCKDIMLPFYFVSGDVKRWVELHDIEAITIKGISYIKIKNRCSKLKDVMCSIHKDRPDVCKDYKCIDN